MTEIRSRSQIAAWLDDLARTQTLIAPQELEGVLLYRPLPGSQELAWDAARPALSAKEFFFPSTERLLIIHKQQAQIELEETLPAGRQVLFGLRPCDARGLLALDAAFVDTDPVDPYYARRRANTTLIGLACRELGPTCFCTATGGAPDDPTGMDLMLFETPQGYRVEVYTERGLEAGAKLGMRQLGISDAGAAGDPAAGSADPNLVSLPPAQVWPASFEDPFWGELAERCLSCRACAYVCPTCRCFDMRDEALPAAEGGQAFERVRCWDSCAGTIYRRIAGGHNPRAAKAERLRNRFLCKFYYYAEQYPAEDAQPGPLACTGCGRCIEACPVNIDITEVLAHLAEVSR